MAFRHRPPSPKEQQQRDRELDAWMDRALGVRNPDPEPKVHDV
jgi:hypothetical protein